MTATLKFSCPACDNLKALMKSLPTLNVDVLKISSLDCVTEVNLYSRFFFVVTAPVVLVLVVALRARLLNRLQAEKVSVQQDGLDSSQETTPKRDHTKDATGLIFLIIFLTCELPCRQTIRCHIFLTQRRRSNCNIDNLHNVCMPRVGHGPALPRLRHVD